MERRLIRARWQVTIPREIRRRLNLWIGQAVSFTLDESMCIVMSTGNLPSGEEAEFYEAFKGKKQLLSRRKKFGISEAPRRSKIGALKEARFEKLEAMVRLFPADAEVYREMELIKEAEGGRQELKNLLSNMSRFILRLQGQI